MKLSEQRGQRLEGLFFIVGWCFEPSQPLGVTSGLNLEKQKPLEWVSTQKYVLSHPSLITENTSYSEFSIERTLFLHAAIPGYRKV